MSSHSFLKMPEDGLAYGADTTRISLKAAKYGMHISFATSKFIGDAVDDLSSNLSSCKFHTSLYNEMMEEIENTVDKGFNYTLAAFDRLQEKWD